MMLFNQIRRKSSSS